MDIIVERANVWAASIRDESGNLAQLLAGLRDAGADLDFVIARRVAEKPGTGVVFVSPLRGDRELAAAANLGFNITSSLHSVRVQGENKPGIAAVLTGKLAAEGINLRGFSAAVIGARFILYIAFDTDADAVKAVNILQQ